MLVRNSRKLLSYSKVHHARCRNLEQLRTSFYYKYRHGPTKICEGPPLDYMQAFKEFFGRKGYEFLKAEFKRTFLERPFRSTITELPKIDETVVFEHFDKEESLKRWKATADSDTFNGYSTAKISRSPDGHALFHGFLDNRIPDDGATEDSGFVAMIGPLKERESSFKFETHWDWSKYNCLEIRFRGDGRRYSLVCNTSDDMDDLSYFDTFSTHMYTKGGPYWETRRIDLAKLVYSSQGFIQDEQPLLPKQTIRFFAITLEDSVDGPFSLEIDYVGLRMSSNPVMEFQAYELYSFPHIQFRRLQVGCAPPDRQLE